MAHPRVPATTTRTLEVAMASTAQTPALPAASTPRIRTMAPGRRRRAASERQRPGSCDLGAQRL
ncbi:unnamed protein product, partial [Symbiodinium microadriaticum]